MKKIALITGANKGIGLETARQLGRKNITIIVGARDRPKGEAAVKKLTGEGMDAHFVELDVSQPTSIEKAAEKVKKDFGRLDILVNNAAIMIDETEKKVSAQKMETWRETLATNVLGLIETTQAFLPLLRKSEAGRIVNLSSILGSIHFHVTPGSPVYESKGMPAYNVSKSAVNAYTAQLAYELKDTKIKVNAAHPGWVKTDMGGEGATMDLADGARTSVELALLEEGGPNGAFMHMGKPLPW